MACTNEKIYKMLGDLNLLKNDKDDNLVTTLLDLKKKISQFMNEDFKTFVVTNLLEDVTRTNVLYYVVTEGELYVVANGSPFQISHLTDVTLFKDMMFKNKYTTFQVDMQERGIGIDITSDDGEFSLFMGSSGLQVVADNIKLDVNDLELGGYISFEDNRVIRIHNTIDFANVRYAGLDGKYSTESITSALNKAVNNASKVSQLEEDYKKLDRNKLDTEKEYQGYTVDYLLEVLATNVDKIKGL